MQRYPAVMLGVFGVTLFVSASLLFLVQPMIGKTITPLLGGTPAVWNTCMVFFQAVLLAGYAYAHGTTAWLGPRKQALLHLAVLVLPFLFFPLAVKEELVSGTENYPVPALLLILVLSVGVPFFVVSTSAPLLQKWFSSTPHPAARDPYFLYGSSNLGSMLALVGYPFVYEYFVPLSTQRTVWAVGYGFLALLVGGCAVLLWLSAEAKTETAGKTATEGQQPAETIPGAAAHPQGFAKNAGKGHRKISKSEGIAVPRAKAEGPAVDTGATRPITWLRRLRWVLLAAIPSSLMLGVTTYMTTDIAAISFLWLPPLTLYLLTFIIVFARTPPIVHKTMVVVMPLLVLALVFFMASEIQPASIQYLIALHLITMFVVAMVCHGELARDRPAARSLTEFFLWMSLGGVLGGLFNGLLAPLIFNGNVEYPLALVAACLLLPSMGWDLDFGKWGTNADVGLATFCTAVGGALIAAHLWDRRMSLNDNLAKDWMPWIVAGLIAAAELGMARLLKSRKRRLACAFDLLLPLALMLLVIGMTWGYTADAIKSRFDKFAEILEVAPSRLRILVTFAVPVILCYTFVERSARFGFGVGAILLAGAICDLTDHTIIEQTRSFFGILRVELDGPYLKLMHGTTLHGMQYSVFHPDYENDHDTPLTYYVASGPIGQLFYSYNPDLRKLNALAAAAGPAPR